mmetsp:Transcript_25522/g.71519  ORF Transcript_25522/g.71519 Transcript_25522/m.71519 type:complete len:641 (+) Transcript_25522:1-1923(+)
MEWYRDYDHIGYNLKGEKILKSQETRDALEKFLEREENPSAFWRTVTDHKNQREVVLSRKDMGMLLRMGRGKYPSKESEFDPYFDTIETAERNVIHPVTNAIPAKRSFLPSKWEAKRVAYLTKAIRKGWISLEEKPKEEEPTAYMLWKEDETTVRKRKVQHIPAPKLSLPTHSESYNPPEEYLLDKSEKRELQQLDPQDRPFNYTPQKSTSLRAVPSYRRLMRESFERCLDLYMCPRSIKLRQNVDPESLLPKLPPKSQLRPFPTSLAVRYEGHRSFVRSLSAHPSGQWLATGSDDGTVRVWEVRSGRCMKVYHVGGKRVEAVAFCPLPSCTILAVAVDKELRLLNVAVGSSTLKQQTHATLIAGELAAKERLESGQKGAAVWEILRKREILLAGATESVTPEGEAQIDDDPKVPLRLPEGLTIHHKGPVKSVVWHRKGDYFAVVIEGESHQVVVHRLSLQKSQSPFKRLKSGKVQAVCFHPSEPIFFVATQRFVRVYNLAKRELVKKLNPNVKWISSIAVHPQGDNLLLGSYDKRVIWFDVDLSSKPYQTMRYHAAAVRSVAFHPKYPLWASCSDDCKTHVFHGTVYPDDYTKNPLLVPLKILSGHTAKSDIGVLSTSFHPQEPWLFTAGADGNAYLYI